MTHAIMIPMLYSKLHNATVTDALLHYQGSIAIDADLLKRAGIREYQQVDVYNITNGERFTTYAIVAEGGSGTIGIRGAAAHLAKPGDKVIICAYQMVPEERVSECKPTIVLLGDKNAVVQG